MNGYQYGYFQAGTGKASHHRMRLMERIRLRRRRRRMDDLEGLSRWIA